MSTISGFGYYSMAIVEGLFDTRDDELTCRIRWQERMPLFRRLLILKSWGATDRLLREVEVAWAIWKARPDEYQNPIRSPEELR